MILQLENLKQTKEKEEWFHLLPKEMKKDLSGSVHVKFGYVPGVSKHKVTVTGLIF